ncbi:hypothetical protein IGJ34_000991 [Enterococcus sp. AZ177]|uniref:Uncharacterized protein n=1 Tax=Enterococcus plantarum TaxID=1077675 RepID=A0A2W3Z1A2_9ENTE|nr:hypothetical protein CI088_15880 [Enterococcus plantarum]
MIQIEYLGEKEDGTVCGSCRGSRNIPTITVKKIYGRTWRVGKPQEVSLIEFSKFMRTGLFKKV